MVYAIPSDVAQVMRRSYSARIIADAFYDGQPTITGMRVAPTGSITGNASGTIQTTAGVDIVSDAMALAGGATISPENAADALATYGQEMVLTRQVWLGGTLVGAVPLGTFRINGADDIRQTGKRIGNGQVITAEMVSLQLDDRFETIGAAKFSRVQSPKSGATVWSEVRRFSPFPIVVAADVVDGSVPRTMVYDEDRLKTISDLFGTRGAAPVLTREGNLTARLIDPIGAGQTPIDISGTIQPFTKSMSNDYVNHIVVTTTNDGKNQTIAEAMITEGPLRYTGPAGDRVQIVDSGLADTRTAALALAQSRLAQGMQSRSQEVKVSCLPNDAVELYDPITATDPNTQVTVTGFVSGYTKPLDPTALMEVTIATKVYA